MRSTPFNQFTGLTTHNFIEHRPFVGNVSAFLIPIVVSFCHSSHSLFILCYACMVWTEPQILFLSYSSAIHANKTIGVWVAVQSAHMVGKYMGIRLCYCSNWILLVHSKIIHNNRKKTSPFSNGWPSSCTNWTPFCSVWSVARTRQIDCNCTYAIAFYVGLLILYVYMCVCAVCVWLCISV